MHRDRAEQQTENQPRSASACSCGLVTHQVLTDDSQPTLKIGGIELAAGILCLVSESEQLADLMFRLRPTFDFGGRDLFRHELPARGEEWTAMPFVPDRRIAQRLQREPPPAFEPARAWPPSRRSDRTRTPATPPRRRLALTYPAANANIRIEGTGRNFGCRYSGIREGVTVVSDVGRAQTGGVFGFGR